MNTITVGYLNSIIKDLDDTVEISFICRTGGGFDLLSLYEFSKKTCVNSYINNESQRQVAKTKTKLNLQFDVYQTLKTRKLK